MAGDTDFIALYQDLGLDPDCSLDAFRQAYRKRVGLLHPDRPGESARSTRELQRLNALYTAAMDFQRRHGRLPGASQTPVAPPSSGPAPAPRPRPAVEVEPRTKPGLLFAVLGLTLVGLWLFATFAPGETAAPQPMAASGPSAAHSSGALATLHATRIIALGATAQQVREIHGDPVSGWEQRWEYGPSWVAFRCGVVVDWYSSPLRPLKVASEYPSASTEWSPPRTCRE
jgi:hypothetical protein